MRGGRPKQACRAGLAMMRCRWTSALHGSIGPFASRRSPDRRTAQNFPSTELRRHGKRAGPVCFSQMKVMEELCAIEKASTFSLKGEK